MARKKKLVPLTEQQKYDIFKEKFDELVKYGLEIFFFKETNLTTVEKRTYSNVSVGNMSFDEFWKQFQASLTQKDKHRATHHEMFLKTFCK